MYYKNKVHKVFLFFGHAGTPIFGRSVNPIPSLEGRLFPSITTGTPNVFHLQASLLHNCFSNSIPIKDTLL